MKVSEDQTVSVTRIRKTLHMEELWLNEHAFASAEMCERASGYIPLSFDAHGYLLNVVHSLQSKRLDNDANNLIFKLYQ